MSPWPTRFHREWQREDSSSEHELTIAPVAGFLDRNGAGCHERGRRPTSGSRGGAIGSAGPSVTTDRQSVWN
jgi:hypothetical protein